VADISAMSASALGSTLVSDFGVKRFEYEVRSEGSLDHCILLQSWQV
jgi:hypothetical protein